MFRILLCPSSGVCDYAVELPHWSYRSSLLCVGGWVPFGLSSIRAAARTFDASFETRTTDTDRLQRVILVASLTAEGEHSLGALASGVLWKVFGFEEGARAGLGHVHNDWPYGWDMCIMTGLMVGTCA